MPSNEVIEMSDERKEEGDNGRKKSIGKKVERKMNGWMKGVAQGQTSNMINMESNYLILTYNHYYK